MRLLNTHTQKLQEFYVDPPSYIILSHGWEDGEVSYEEHLLGQSTAKAGYKKILDFCHYAKRYTQWEDRHLLYR